MSCRAGFVWATSQHFNRYIEECGVSCELVTPHMLAAPFYRPVLSCLIIPTGFGNPAYSNLLPALRASSPRIRRFVETGGSLLVFGAAAEKPDAYDWLPFGIVYRHDCHPRSIAVSFGSLRRVAADEHVGVHDLALGKDGTDLLDVEVERAHGREPDAPVGRLFYGDVRF